MTEPTNQPAAPAQQAAQKVCAQCETNARDNEAGGYNDLAKECREYCRRGHKPAAEPVSEPPERVWITWDDCYAWDTPESGGDEYARVHPPPEQARVAAEKAAEKIERVLHFVHSCRVKGCSGNVEERIERIAAIILEAGVAAPPGEQEMITCPACNMIVARVPQGGFRAGVSACVEKVKAMRDEWDRVSRKDRDSIGRVTALQKRKAADRMLTALESITDSVASPATQQEVNGK